MRRVVTASTGAGTMAWVKSLGADVVVDYKQRSALEAVADDSVDFVYDNHGASGTVELAMTKLSKMATLSPSVALLFVSQR